MLGKVIIENGQKKIQALTADTGTGAPVGSIIVVCSNILPSGYLGLGVQYDITNYPALYQVLGTDTTPTASALGLPTLSSGQYAIKATSGLTENQQENVLNTINENLSYSTEEHPTGKKWIDGKPIYSKVVDLGALGSESAWSKNVLHGISNISTVVSADALTYQENGIQYEIMPCYQSDNQILGRIMVTSTNIYLSGYGDWSYYKARVIIEYTKTTDN